MKRMTVIAVALCLIMITTVGAGVVTAKQEANPRQAGASSIYFFDLSATDTHGAGKLMINTKEHTFVFNGKDFKPSQQYILQARAASGEAYVFASGKSTSSGNLHVAGTWEKDAALPSARGFGVSPISAITGTAYYIPPSTTLTTPRYIFEMNDGGAYYYLNFAGTVPQPADFGSGKIGAQYVQSAYGTYLTLDNGKVFDDVGLSQVQELQRTVYSNVQGTDEFTYTLNQGFTASAAPNIPLLGLPAGTFAPYPSQTAIKAVVLDTSLIVDPSTNQWSVRCNVIIFDPIRYSEAYTIEPY
ncbi:MAG: hypothetical protein ACXV5N_10000 [Halobacteriota archaeon]